MSLKQMQFLDGASAIRQEPVTWGVDWGKAGDIPCVSIIKRLPNGGIEVIAVEYAPSRSDDSRSRTLPKSHLPTHKASTTHYCLGFTTKTEVLGLTQVCG